MVRSMKMNGNSDRIPHSLLQGTLQYLNQFRDVDNQCR